MSLIYGVITNSITNNSINVFNAFDQNLAYTKRSIKNENWLMGKLDFSTKTSSNTHLSHPKYQVWSDARIYNKEVLYSKLGVSNSDRKELATDALILKCFEKWGKEFIHQVNGDFVILIYDKEKKTTYIFRDPIGVRPFYYSQHTDGFYFSSQLKSLIRLPTHSSSIDWQYTKEMLCLDFPNHRELTVFEHIKRLPPGHLMTIVNEVITIERYHYFEKNEIRFKSDEEYLEAFRVKLETAVFTRMPSHEKVIGTHQSGGLDSGGIASIGMARCRQTGQELHGFGLSLPQNREQNSYGVNDDKSIIHQLSENIGLSQLHFVGKDKITLNQILDESLEMFPSPIGIFRYEPVHSINEVAHQHGIKTMFSGFGGDECVTFNNPPAYIYHLAKQFKLGDLYKAFQTYPKGIYAKYLLSSMPLFYNLLKKRGYQLPVVDHLKRSNKRILIKDEAFNIRTKEAYLTRSHVKDIHSYITTLLNRNYTVARIENGVAFSQPLGITMSYPLLDVDLINFFLALPERQQIKNKEGRLLYRQAISKWTDLDAFIYQKKSRTTTNPTRPIRYLEGVSEINDFIDKFSRKASYDFINWAGIKENLNASTELKRSNRKLMLSINDIYMVMRVVYFLEKYG